jgi:hypothetical protein
MQGGDSKAVLLQGGTAAACGGQKSQEGRWSSGVKSQAAEGAGTNPFGLSFARSLFERTIPLPLGAADKCGQCVGRADVSIKKQNIFLKML